MCTLATCKPNIRRVAMHGDWVVGTGSSAKKRPPTFVYVMRVTETLTFDEYWADSRFLAKRPNLSGSQKQAFGDNIYHSDAKSGAWIQEDSHHSYADGAPNLGNLDSDTQTDRVLISNEFAYWGGQGPPVPERFRSFDGYDIRAIRNHKSVFSQHFVDEFVVWVRLLDESGCIGDPKKWERDSRARAPRRRAA
jgi:hypothetical protein